MLDYKKINWIFLLKAVIVFIATIITALYVFNIIYSNGFIHWSWLEYISPEIKKIFPLGFYFILIGQIGSLFLLHIKGRSMAWGLFIILGVPGFIALSILSLILKKKLPQEGSVFKKGWARLFFLGLLYLLVGLMLILPFIEKTQSIQKFYQEVIMHILNNQQKVSKDRQNTEVIISSLGADENSNIQRWTSIHTDKFEYYGDSTPPSWMYNDGLTEVKHAELMKSFFNFIPKILLALGLGKIDYLMANTERELIRDAGGELVKNHYEQSVDYFSSYKDGLIERQDWFPYRTETGASGISVYGNFKLLNGQFHRYFISLVLEDGKPVIAGFLPTFSYEEFHDQELIGTVKVIN